MVDRLYDERIARRRLDVAAVTMCCNRNPRVNRDRLFAEVQETKVEHPDVALVIFGEMITTWYDPQGIADSRHVQGRRDCSHL
jgi:hypothetical protein